MIVLESLSLAQTRGRRPPRVVIVVQTPPRVTVVVPTPCCNHSCRNSRTARNDSDELGLDPVVIHVSQPLLESLSWCQPLLVSLSWFKPGERLSLANGWMCQYPYGKDSGFRLGSRTGGKVTCRNSKTARNDSDQLGLDPVVIHVSQPLLES